MLIADSVILLSIYKPILFAISFGLWAYAVAWLDKDVSTYRMPKLLWKSLFMGVGMLSFWLWLTIPFFWLGILVAILLNLGLFLGYHFYRNTKVPKDRQWNFSLDPFKTKLDAFHHKQSENAASIKIINSSGKAIPVPMANEPLAPIHAVLAQLMDFALPRGANRIDIVTDTTKTAIVAHVDGVTYPQPDIEPPQGLALTDYLKLHAGLDVQDRRRKQKGNLKINAESLGTHKIQITTSGNNRGVALALEINPGGVAGKKIEDLGLLDSQLAQLKPLLDDEQGRVVLVTGLAKQGITTTLYSLAARHDPYTQSVMALEETFEIELEGVNNEAIKTGPEAKTLAEQINSIMLREPKVLLLGQLSDPESAKVLARFASETRIYVGLRQGDTTLALRAWIQAVGDAKDAANAIGGVITQRLIRQVCPTCKQGYTPDPALLKKLNLSADKVSQFYKHSGQVLVKNEPQMCPNCKGIGYKGQVAVFEIMVLDDEARDFAADGHFDQLRTHLRKKRMMLLQEAALGKVVQGVTTISEITRVLSNK